MRQIKQLVLILLLAVGSTIGQKAMASCTLTGSITKQTYANYDQLTVNVSGGSGHYEYRWSANLLNNPYNIVDVNNNGLYSITVWDTTSGCYIILSDTVSNLPCSISDSISVTFGANGLCHFTAHTSGAPHAVYAWSLHPVAALFHGGNTASNTYPAGPESVGVTIYDSVSQCSYFDSLNFVVPAYGCNLTGSISSQIIYTSYDQLTANVAGGSGHYSYSWSANASSNYYLVDVANNGVYSVTVTDDSTACQTVLSYTLTALGCSIADSITYVNLGNGSYKFKAHTTGATHPLYTWTLPGWQQVTTAHDTISYTFPAGLQSITVYIQDSTTGCNYFDSISFVVPAHCNLSGNISQQNHGSYAALAANVSGASPYATYTWSNGFNGINDTVYLSGYYCVTVTDTNGCSLVLCDSASTTTTCHLAISFNNTINGSQAGAVATVSGANGSVTGNWMGIVSYNYDSISVNNSGLYCYQVTDAIGCVAQSCDSINIPGCHISGSLNAAVYAATDTFRAVVTGGSSPYDYVWSSALGFVSTGSDPDFGVASYVGTGGMCLSVTDTVGCVLSLCDTVVSVHACSAAFTSFDSCGWIDFQPVNNLYHDTFTYVFSDGTTYSSTLSDGFVNHQFPSPGSYTVTMYLRTTAGCRDTFSAVVYAANIPCITSDTICGTVFQDLNGDGVQDNGEPGLANQEVHIGPSGGYAYTDANGNYTYAVASGIYNIRFVNPNGYTVTIPLGPTPGRYDSVHISGGYTHCGFNFGIVDSDVTISGYVYFDANNNGVMDAGESGNDNATVYIGPHFVSTDATGFYTWTGPAGSYTVSYSPYSYYTAYVVVPLSIFANATTAGSVYANNNFGLQVSTAACDVATKIIANTTVTAGYPAWYDVYVENYGTNVASGTMTFFYDPSLTYGYSIPNASSVNTTNNVVTFTYTGLQPGQYEDFYVYFTANNSVAIGQSTFELATATDNCIESNLSNNTDTIHQNATGSWDPNFKGVTPSGQGAQGLITATQPLRYTIGFQNTGTAPAVNVVLQDNIPSTLNISTLKVIGASHPNYAIQIDGRMLVCKFSQIMLPDSAASEQASHGYLSFEIAPAQGIADGIQIQNTASIFFDYNAAVVTNTTLNTVDNALSIRDIADHATITVVPNPLHDYTTISVSGIDMTDATLEVYDVMGQKVSVSTQAVNGVFHLDRGAMSAGIYSYSIKQNDKAIGTGKLVVE
jgi:uncharacterized repeat protein (TIGR01451 family)